ncbi:MAG: hypothetical protein L6W00_12240 [Lentisphaeria bacterium]|nr:MAG: hypothetical protein L6W00_12240 [Lentisphaeria bacterium]
MKFTNKFNLPRHICDWLAFDEYDYNPDTISATTLIGPARAWALKRLNADNLTMDYSDLLAVRYGTAIHDSLEKGGRLWGGGFPRETVLRRKNGIHDLRQAGRTDRRRDPRQQIHLRLEDRPRRV